MQVSPSKLLLRARILKMHFTYFDTKLYKLTGSNHAKGGTDMPKEEVSEL